ncbi:DNA polymerase III subunit beta [Patescibacteria group bacterium]
MKVTCEKKYIQEASSSCEKISGHNSTLPILSSVLISTEKNKLKFSSTNLELGLEFLIPAKIEKEGKIALPAKLFSGLISSLTGDKSIRLASVNNNLVLTTTNTSTTMKGYNVEDFPVLPKVKEKKSFIISSTDMIIGLKSVYYSTALSEMKPELNSVFVFSSKNMPLTFVATDSFRLSEKTIQYNFSDSFNFLIPHKSVVEILRIFENKNEDIRILLDENNFTLQSNNITFISRLIEGNFVDYKQIIPNDFSNKVIVDKKQLVEALRSAVMFCGNLNEIRVKIYGNESFLEIQTSNPDLGEHVVKIPGKIEGEDLSIVFNQRYLIDCFSSLNSEKVLLKFAGEGRPLLITCLDDISFRYLVMPMKNV